MQKIDLVEYIACKRSGHHAMINWIIANTIGEQIYHWYKLIFMDGGNQWHWNDPSKNINEGRGMFKDSTFNYQKFPSKMSVNYEDEYSNYCFFGESKKSVEGVEVYDYNGVEINIKSRILFIRDFYDNLWSRFMGIKNNIVGDAYCDKKFIETWKDHARYALENPHKTLKYEDWMSDTDKRQEFLLINFGVSEELGDLSNITGTATSNPHKVEKNFSLLPQDIKELIREDIELHNLIEELGYKNKVI